MMVDIEITHVRAPNMNNSELNSIYIKLSDTHCHFHSTDISISFVCMSLSLHSGFFLCILSFFLSFYRSVVFFFCAEHPLEPLQKGSHAHSFAHSSIHCMPFIVRGCDDSRGNAELRKRAWNGWRQIMWNVCAVYV